MFTIYLDLDVFYDAYLDTNKQVNPFAPKPLTFLEYFGKTTYQTVFLDFDEEEDINKLHLLMQFVEGKNPNAPTHSIRKRTDIGLIENSIQNNPYIYLFLHKSHFSYFKTQSLQSNILVFTDNDYLNFINEYDYHNVTAIDKDKDEGCFEWDDLLPEFPTNEIIIIDDFLLYEKEDVKLTDNIYYLLEKLKDKYKELEKIVIFTGSPWSYDEFKNNIAKVKLQSKRIIGFEPIFIIWGYHEKKEHDRFLLANYFRIKFGSSIQFLDMNRQIKDLKKVFTVNSDSYFDYKIAQDALIPLSFAKEKLAEKKRDGKIKEGVNSKLLNI